MKTNPIRSAEQRLVIYTDERCEAHSMQPHHPESPARLRHTLEHLAAIGFLDEHPLLQPNPADAELLRLVHSSRYLDHLNAINPANTRGAATTLAQLDGDTALNHHTLDAAALAAGAAVDAVAGVMTGKHQSAFCAVRPPGHHAERDVGMGFCFYNSIAVAAISGLERHGVERVAILDFDVHHGNGTVDIFRNDPRVLVCSSFQHPYYPGRHQATHAPNIVNSPLSAGSGEREFRAAIEQDWAAALGRHRPELILVSAGFDAHIDDPLADLRLTEADFRWVTDFICDAASTAHCRGRIVSLLEGGYNLDALARSVAAHLEGLRAGLTPR